MLEFFFTQISVIALIALVSLVIFVSVVSFAFGSFTRGYWDGQEGLEAALSGAATAAAVVVALWLAGLAACFLIDLFGGVLNA